MGPKKVAQSEVWMVPSEVLRVNLDVFLTYTRTFSNREPIPFSKANALSYAHTKVGNDQMHIRGGMTSGKWSLSGFVRSRSESLWWFEVDLWPLCMHLRRGPPTMFRKHMPWGIRTASLGMVGCIFAENGPLEGGIESNSGVPAGVLRVNSDGFLASIRAFSKGAPTIFRKHMPWGMGTESFGMIGCIFGENGPLEGGIEWSLNGTVRGAKGEFRRFYYLYPYIFESRAHTFFKRKCPELCAHQSWEWSDSYSWRNDFLKVEFEHVCKKPAGVLMVIWSGFWPIRVHFRRGAQPFSESTCPEV